MSSAASWMRWLRPPGRPGYGRSALVAEVMEPRILYSADLGAALALGSGFAGIAEQRTLTEGGEYAAPAVDPATGMAAANAPSSARPSTELAFVDMSVAGAEDLVSALQAQRQGGRSIEIVRIAADEDGVVRITDTLASRGGIAAIHVLSHGADGVIHLGSARIDGATLKTHGQEIAAWGRALTDDADLLLYGCDVAASPAGERFLAGLGALTGADVAASADLTGAAALGGNWSMEQRTGPIEAAIAIDLPTQLAWQGVLAAAPTVSPISDQTTLEDTATAAIAFTVGDADTPLADLVVTANASDAAILASGGIVLGGGGANRTLTLTPVAGASGPVTVTVDVSDGTLVTSTSFQLTVTAVNAAPAGVDKTLTLDEDTPYTLTPADFGFSDVDDAPANAFQAVRFATAPAAGTLANNGVAVGAGAWVTAADIAAGKLVYTPAPNASGIAYAAVTFQVQDDGGTANGGADLSSVANTLTFDVSPVNDAPVNDVARKQTTDEDKAFQMKTSRGTAITVSDVEGGTLTTTVSTNNGTLFAPPNPNTIISGNRTASITISGTAADINVVLDGMRLNSVDDYNGFATLTVTTSEADPAGLSTTDVVEVTIVPVPDIVADTANTLIDTPVVIDVLANDTFKNVGATITQVNGSAIADGGAAVTVPKGSVALLAGKLVFTPQAGFTGAVPSFSYTVSSGGVDETAKKNVDVTVVAMAAPVNTVPAAQVTAEDTPQVFSTANGNAIRVADADSATLTTTVSASNGTLTAQAFAGATIANNGSATLTISGTAAAINGALDGLVYASAADYNGSAVLTVSTSDGILIDSDPIAMTISAVADAVPDSVGTSENTALSFNVLTGTNGASADSFEDPARSVTGVTQGAHGSVSFTAAGVLTYTPQAAYNGVDSFSYTVSSGGVTEVATVNLTIVGVNHAPVNTVPGTQTVDEDMAITITGISVNDPDGNLGSVRLAAGNGTLTVSLAGGAAISAGANGSSTLTLSGSQAQIDAALATLAYQGRLNFNGADTLTVLSSDNAGTPLTDTDTVALVVRAVNDAPVAVADSLTAVQGTPVTYTAMQLLANDSDVDNPISDLRIAGVTSGVGGTAVLNADGTVTFTPNAGFNGAAGFTYTVIDGSVSSASPATVSVAVGVVSHAPVAVNDSLDATEDTPITFGAADLLANDTDADTPNSGLTIASVTSGSGGTAVLNANGTVTFTPNANFNGVADFSYMVSDGDLGSAATVTVYVAPVDDAPVAVTDSLFATEDTPMTFGSADLLGNDTDIDTPHAGLRIVSVASGAGGAAVLNADGTVTFTPTVNFNGPADFSYTVGDGLLASTAVATVGVPAVNDAPVAVGDSLAAGENTSVTFGAVDLLGNDTDVDTPNAALAIASVTGGAGGTAVLNADGSVTFTPGAGFKGVADFAYTVTDGALTSTLAATVTVTVTGVDNPVSAPKPAAPPEAAPEPPSVAVPPTQPVSGPLVEPVPAPPAPGEPPVLQADVTPAAASGAPPSTTPGSAPSPTPAATAQATPAAPPASAATGPVQAAVTHSEMGAPAAGFGLVIDGLPATVQVDRNLMVFARPIIDLVPSTLVQRISMGGRAVQAEAAPESALVFASFNLAGRAEGASGPDLQRTLRSSIFSDQLDQLRGNLQEELELDKTVAVSVAGVSLGLSLVYVMWLVRGGVLMGSYLSALPAWRVLDPLPVLSRVDDDAEEDDEAFDAATRTGGDPLRGFG